MVEFFLQGKLTCSALCLKHTAMLKLRLQSMSVKPKGKVFGLLKYAVCYNQAESSVLGSFLLLVEVGVSYFIF